MVPSISPWVLLAFSQWQIPVFAIPFLLPAFLIPGLFITRGRKRRAEIEFERLKRQAETENKRLQDLIANVPGVVWETRIDPVTHQHTTTS
jgi:hypothetical protein